MHDGEDIVDEALLKGLVCRLMVNHDLLSRKAHDSLQELEGEPGEPVAVGNHNLADSSA